MINRLISIALEEGVPIIDAYNMATFNIAKYYQIDDLLGVVGPGRLASLNVLDDPMNPNPETVISKGVILKLDGENQHQFQETKWENGGLVPLDLVYDLTTSDLQFSMPLGVKMRNAVIMEPYTVEIDNSVNQLSCDHDQSFFSLIDRKGEWRVNTMLKGFANKVQGFVSSFSLTGDILVIGKNKEDMMLAHKRMKEIGGGSSSQRTGKFCTKSRCNYQAVPLLNRLRQFFSKYKPCVSCSLSEAIHLIAQLIHLSFSKVPICRIFE